MVVGTSDNMYTSETRVNEASEVLKSAKPGQKISRNELENYLTEMQKMLETQKNESFEVNDVLSSLNKFKG